MLFSKLLRPGCAPFALLLTLVAPGCFTEVSLPPAQPPRAPAAPAALPAHVPVGAPQAVQIPGPPPPPQAEAAPVCEDGEIGVGGYWDFFGEWSWVSGFCARIPPGHAYVAPTYADGRYVRGHFTPDEEAGRWRPSRVRLVHPPGLVLNEPHRRRPVPARAVRQDPAPPQMPAYMASVPAPQQGAAFAPAPADYAQAAQAQFQAQDPEKEKDKGPTLEQCLSKATARRRDPACVPVLGGELRVR